MRGTPSGKQIVVVGLGNPGKSYSRNRHNLGFMVVDQLAREANGVWKPNREDAEVCRARVENQDLVLAKPQTFMNLSGKAVAPLLRRVNANPARMIVVHDDLDLQAGKVRVKIGGGDGGHKGIRSISDSLRFRDFIRVRLGIGRPPEVATPTEFVLTDFLPEDHELLTHLVLTGAEAVRLVVRSGVEQAQNTIHCRKLQREPAVVGL